MKYNFIVSNLRELWIEGASHLFIVEPFVYYELKKEGKLQNYLEIKVAPYRRKSRFELENDFNFVQHKYTKYHCAS